VGDAQLVGQHAAASYTPGTERTVGGIVLPREPVNHLLLPIERLCILAYIDIRLAHDIGDKDRESLKY
jgi:hypothetical protein